MNNIFVITSNKYKLREITTLIPAIQGFDIDLPEIQETDAHAVILAKLTEAQKHLPADAIIVEDTSLYIDAMNGLPGPLAKWFVKSIGIEGIYALTETFKSAAATAQTLIGYAEVDGSVHFFEGTIKGTIVPPRGTDGFGWDAVFQPEGSEKTFAEMALAEKSQYSMRKIALEGLQHYLSTNIL
ncbi:non-canonical purine NTP pyrophosphatase [Ktedonospora formicarum]|uniref:Non-canonical purine NTP pyrophosphatase n=1 Tax=Ktedonospora formicarum TaxID=2778364 RepID=A0A8J3MNG5_9CHLR|nr:non-canonical purine NTP pyrophosphatase [Ktedonospora formicarum]GHO41890.1 non-canonical purine NTP pyrophosphatase [Ktedonospora formicarum]